MCCEPGACDGGLVGRREGRDCVRDDGVVQGDAFLDVDGHSEVFIKRWY